MWLGVLSKIFSASFGLWLAAVLFVAYNIAHPSSSCSPRDREQLRCYEPLLSGESRVTIEFLSSTSSNARAIERLSSDTRLLFRKYGTRLSEVLHEDIEVELGAEVRIDGKKLFGYLNISSEEHGDSDVNVRKQYSVLVGPIEMTKMMQTSNHYSQQTRSLLDNPTNTPVSSSDASAMRPYFKYLLHPLTIRYVDLSPPGVLLGSPELPVLMHSLRAKYVYKQRGQRGGYQHRVYEPLLFVDEVSLLSSHWREISSNVSNPSPRITLRVVPTSVYIFAFKKYMELVVSMLGNFLKDAELDEFRWMISDDRIYVFVLTNIITLLHIVFEYLAFYNDYKFFVGTRRRHFKGISKSSLIFSVVQSVVIFLYLHDSRTSQVVLFGILKDIVYGSYKVYVVMLQRRPSLKEEEECVDSDDGGKSFIDDERDERLTEAYDATATTHLLYIIVPLFLGFSTYCLQRYQYRSWWSWLVSCLADAFYFVGFAHMLPQIYINYKYQSVAFLPLRALMYKAFNTFIDDVFAFAIKMPLKHRLMTLRDDFVFLLFIYQWLAYPSDRSRSNEFGFRYSEAHKRLGGSKED